MVESGGLENRCAGNRTEGSNPSPSASRQCAIPHHSAGCAPSVCAPERLRDLRGAARRESVGTPSPRALPLRGASRWSPRRRTRVLIVANRTASTFRLVEAVRDRAEAGPCEFALLIPDVTDRKQADWTMETAQRVLRPAARGTIEGLVGGTDPFASVQEAVREGSL